MKTENRRINIYINTDESTKSLDKLSKSSALAADRLQKLQAEGKALDAEGLPTDEAKRLQDLLEGNAEKAQLLADQINGKVEPSLKQLRNQSAALRRELEALPHGTQEFVDKTKQLQAVEARLKSVQDEIKDTRTSWQKMRDDVKTFGLFAGATVAGEVVSNSFAALQQFFIGAVDNAAKLSDELADIRKTTGMTQEEVEKLNSSLGKLNTRTSSADLRGIARIAGQLGIANNELLGFVESVDKAVVALGDEFGGGAEQVAKEIGALQKLFADTRKMEAGDAINRIGSALNALGSAGSATAPVVAEFTKRIGALGTFAPKINETLGLGAALEELGLSAEISSGGIANILLTMAQSPAAFGKFIEQSGKAGITAKQFGQLIKTDTNAALMAFAKTLAGEDNDTVAQSLVQLKIGSQEAVKVMGLLANQTDFVREKQALAATALQEATSLTDEFRVKNENLAASMEKASKFASSLVAGITKPFVLAVAAAADAVNNFRASINKEQAAQKDYSNGIREQITLLRTRQQQLNAELDVLKQGNLSKQQRDKLMQGINDKYKDLLPYQLTEQMNEQDLAKVQEQVNNNLMKRIALKVKDAEMTEKIQKMLELQKKIDDEEAKQLTNRVAAQGAQNQTNEDPSARALRLRTQKLGEVTSSFNIAKAKQELEAIQKSIDAADETYKRVLKQLGIDEGDNKNDNNNLPPPPDDKEKERLRKEREKAEADAARAIEDLRISLLADGLGKEMALLRLQADRKKAEAKGTAEQIAQQQQLIEEKFLQDAEAVRRKYDDLEVQRAQEQADILAQLRQWEIDDALAREQAYYDTNRINANNAFLQKSAELLANQLLTEEERAAALALLDFDLKQAELDAERTFLESKLALNSEYGFLTEEQKKEIENRLLGIQVASNNNQIAEEKRLAQERDKVAQRRLKVASDVVGGLQSLNQIVNGQAAESNKFGKALALSQIAIDTAKAISSGVASAQTVPFPGNLAAIATTIGTVMANVAAAKKILFEAPETPTPPTAQPIPTGGYMQGGFTPTAPSDATPVGVVHANEYVVPSWLLDVPNVRDMVSIIEAARVQGRVPDSAPVPMASPMASPAATARTAPDTALMATLISEVRGLRQDLAAWQSKLQVQFVHEDFVEFEAKKARIETLAGL